jgi:hypothetical protein
MKIFFAVLTVLIYARMKKRRNSALPEFAYPVRAHWNIEIPPIQNWYWICICMDANDATCCWVFADSAAMDMPDAEAGFK